MNDNLLTTDELEELIDMARSKNEYSFCFVDNPILGKVALPHGRKDNEQKIGFGYEHIVYSRFIKDSLSIDNISMLIIKALEILKSATKDKISETLKNKRKIVEMNNIKIVLSQKKIIDSDVWIITGYPLFEENTKTIKKETLDFLSTVNATKEYAQYYSYFRNIVGALVSNIIISKNSQNVNGGQEV